MIVALIAFVAIAVCFEVFVQIAFRNTKLHRKLGWHSNAYGTVMMPATYPLRECRWCHRTQIHGFMSSNYWMEVDIG